jgi:NAD(P)-dependent dehydrogenase (short-subunit alcohol dehydrogenase family)
VPGIALANTLEGEVPMDKQTLKDKVVVITGASSGFGKGAALAFAQEGAQLVLAARRSALLDAVARECEAHGVAALSIPTDVSKADEVEYLVQAACIEFGGFDVWVNDAGVGALGRFERVPLEDHVKVIETDLLGTLYGTYFAYRQFLGQGWGTVINIASEVGRHALPYHASYAAAKHGVIALGHTLRQEIELNHAGDVHVCTVLPTAHDTPFFDHSANYTGHEVQAPGPLHDPQDVVNTIVRLAQNPADEEIVGCDGVVKVLMHKLAPSFSERLEARQLHRIQIDQAPPAGDSPGAVHEPLATGTEVSAGRRAQEQ